MSNNNRSLLRRVFPTAHQLALDRVVMPRLNGITGDVLILGAGSEDYKKYIPKAQTLIQTDIAEGNNIDIIVDAHKIQFEAERFDTVVAIEVFEHLKSPVIAAAEIFRVLRNNGVILLSIPFMFRIHGDPYDFQRFTKSGLHELLKNFNSLRITSFGGRQHVFSDLLTTVYRPFAALRFLNHLIASKFISFSPSRDCPSGFVVEAFKKIE